MKTLHDLSPSQERYLATILLLESEKACAKAGEIAGKLSVHRSSVTAALRLLADREMIQYEPYGAVTLSPKGKIAAHEVMGRCSVIKEFLERALNIEREAATDAACRMQHAVPRTVIDRMASQIGATNRCPGDHSLNAVTSIGQD